MKKVVFLMVLVMLLGGCCVKPIVPLNNRYEVEAYKKCTELYNITLWLCGDVHDYCMNVSGDWRWTKVNDKKFSKDEYDVCMWRETKKCQKRMEDFKSCVYSEAKRREDYLNRQLYECRLDGGCK